MTTILKRGVASKADRDAFAWLHPYIDQRMEHTVLGEVDGRQLVRSHQKREIFAFNADDIGDVVFDVRGIKDALATRRLTYEMVDAEMSADWVEHVRTNGGVEAEHMARLTAQDLERPGVSVVWRNGYTTMIDGNNRLVRRWDDGLRTFRFARIPMTARLRNKYMCRPGEEEKFFDKIDGPGVESIERIIIR